MDVAPGADRRAVQQSAGVATSASTVPTRNLPVADCENAGAPLADGTCGTLEPDRCVPFNNPPA
jgi:hypothetical protein